MLRSIRDDIETVFASRWVVGGLVAIALGGSILSLTEPQTLPPKLVFGGTWMTLLFWLVVGFALTVTGLVWLRGVIRQARQRGVVATLNRRILTSIPLAIGLIALLVLIGLIQTLVPQLDFNRRVDLIAQYGPENFRVIESLGLFRIFSAWYTYAILGLFLLNLTACTVKRLRASLRYVRQPLMPKRPTAFAHMPCSTTIEPARSSPEDVHAGVRRVLSRRRYRVRESGDQVLAERRRWERYAIDVFHVALIVAILALGITNFFGYNETRVAHEGNIIEVPNRDFHFRVEEFWSVNYRGTERVMDWKTRLTVVGEQGRELASGITQVNHPFTYGGISVYQTAMGKDWLNAAIATFRVTDGKGRSIREIQAQVGETVTLEKAGITIAFDAFLPDFALADGVPYSRTQQLNNPAAHVIIRDASTEERLMRTWAFSKMPRMQRVNDTPYNVYLEGFKAPQFTGLELSWDPGVPVAYSAFGVMVVMLVANLMLSHQMVWVHLDRTTGKLQLGGRSRKGDFTPEFERIAQDIAAELDPEPESGQDRWTPAPRGGS